MLSYAGKKRSSYQGMSESELDAELAIGDIEIAAKKLESAVVNVEVEAMVAEDKAVNAKSNTIYNNLKAKYGDRDLTKPEFMYESGYGESKTKDFLAIYGSFDIGLIALRIVADANDETLRDDNHKRLTSYLETKYKAYIGIPIEYLEMECQESHKVVLPIAKKLMGLHSKSVVKFIPPEIVAQIVMESI